MQRFALSWGLASGTQRAPRLFALGMLIGVLVYFAIDFEPDGRVLFGAWLLVLAIWRVATVRDVPAPVSALCLVLVGAISGAGSGALSTARIAPVQLTAPLGPVYVEGWVMDIEPARRGVRLSLRVHAIDGLAATDTPARVRLTHISALKTESGRFVRCWAVLRPPPQPVIAGDYDFARQAGFAGLGAVGYVQGRCRGGPVGPPTDLGDGAVLQIGTWRRQLAQHVRAHAGTRAGGFAAALASGDRSFMRPDDQEALRGAGLAHLLAISGLHMGIVGGLVFLLVWRGLSLIEPVALRWTVKKPAAIAALITCTSYLVISGASVSTQRAFVMAAVMFGGVLLDRAALSLRSLAIAMIIVLAIHPASALTPGFQMSFAATGALIATYETWQKAQRAQGDRRSGVRFWIASLFVTSAVSSLATLPFAVYHFGRVAGLGLIANLAAMPIISLVSAPFAAAALILAPLGWDGLALRAFGLSLEAVLAIAHAVSGWGFGEPKGLPRMPVWSLLGLVWALWIYVVSEPGRARLLIMLLIIVGALFVWARAGTARLHWAPSGELFYESPQGRVTGRVLRNGDGLSPLRFVGKPIDPLCPDLSDCEISVQGRRIRLHTPNEDSSSLVVQDVAVTWEDVVRENGITLIWQDGRFQKLQKQVCGTRRWRPCLEP